jgi:putative thymidine phosphorylase
VELKIKTSHWSAGLPVAMLNRKTAEQLGVHSGDRVTIKTLSKNPKQIATLVDTIESGIRHDHISVSSEIKKILSLRENQTIDVSFSVPPISVSYIKKKLMGEKLTSIEIRQIIEDIVSNTLSEPEVAVFISGMYKNGMVFEETVALVNAILYSGETLGLKNKFVVDKHCIGGIAGNRTTPIVVAICAANGLIMPKTSSRAITSAAGTADCIETIAPVEFSMEKLKKIVKKAGACLTWGGALGMVPADSIIIKVEKMLKLDPEAQLLASIMSKKLAASSKYILIDIPYGNGAKVTKSRGLRLKKKFEKLGMHFKVKVKCVLTRTDEPIGNGVGPALEMIDVMKVLNNKKESPKDLEDKSVYLAGLILEMTGKIKKGKGAKLARETLASGAAWKKFGEIIKAQKGKTKDPTVGKYTHDVCAPKSGKIKTIDNKQINYLARVAGCPLDKKSGVYLHHHVNDKVKNCDVLLTIYAESKPRLEEALKYYESTHPIKI